MASTREIERNWTPEQLQSDSVSKKEVAAFLQQHANKSFLKEHKLQGQLKNVTKTAKKENLILSYEALFETKAFKGDEEEDKVVKEVTKATEELKVSAKGDTPAATVPDEPPKYKMRTLKKGDKVNIPKKGDTVCVWYTGRLQDGTQFDTNVVTGRKAKSAQPLRFKVGTGKVIRGWDEALLKMSSGEKVELTIEPEWAYGRKGNPDGGIPPHATLIFDMELANIQ